MAQLPEPRTIAAFAILLVAALASTWALFLVREDAPDAPRPELSLAYYLDRAVLTGTSADGTVIYRVSTRRAEQRPSDESITLQGIEMNYGPPTGLPWDVRATRGRIPPDASIIELAGDVVAVSGEGHPNRTEIRTERLDIDPDAMLARTDRKVTIMVGSRQLDARGMEAEFDTNRLRLLSNVHGKFLP